MGPTLADIRARSRKTRASSAGVSSARSVLRGNGLLCVVGSLLQLPFWFIYFTNRASPVAAVSLRCTVKSSSTLNMSFLRLSHAEGKKKKKKGSGREEVGKLLRRQVPPLFDALMLIHSERTSCLSAYAESPFCCFFSVCGAPLCFLFLSCFLSLFFFLSTPVR